MITIILQDGFCDVALTSNTWDMGTDDNLSFGNNVQSGTTFGDAGSLTCEKFLYIVIKKSCFIFGFRELHWSIHSNRLLGRRECSHERWLRHQLLAFALLASNTQIHKYLCICICICICVFAGKWSDQYCTTKHHFICERTIPPL